MKKAALHGEGRRTSGGLALCDIRSNLVGHNDIKTPRGCHRPLLLSIAHPGDNILAFALASPTEAVAFSRQEDRERNTERIACLPEQWALCKSEVNTDEAHFDIREYRNGVGDKFWVADSKDEAWRNGGFPIFMGGEDRAHEGEQPLRIVSDLDINLRHEIEKW